MKSQKINLNSITKNNGEIILNLYLTVNCTVYFLQRKIDHEDTHGTRDSNKFYFIK